MSNYNPIKTAYALADAYGHGWVKYVSLAQAEEIFATSGGDLAATATKVNAIVSAAEDAEGLETWQRCTGLYTAGAPNSYFSHETASGRTRWQIGAQQASIQITRPGDVVVASATLAAGRLEISWPGVDDDAHPDRIIGLRHIEALAFALRALYRAELLADVEMPAFVPLSPDGGLDGELRAILAWAKAADAHLRAAQEITAVKLGHSGEHGWVEAHLYDYTTTLARVAQDVIDEAARAALRRRLA